MNEGLIPRRYAKALYAHASEHGADAHIYELMKTLSNSFAEQTQLQAVMSNPYIPATDKTALLITAAGATAKDTCFLDFLKLLTENHRIEMARSIALAYADIYRSKHNIHVVDVYSADEMSDENETRLKNIITGHLDGGTMEYTHHIDPSLIGGVVVTVGNERLDASLSNELKQLRLKLLSK